MEFGLGKLLFGWHFGWLHFVAWMLVGCLLVLGELCSGGFFLVDFVGWIIGLFGVGCVCRCVFGGFRL